MIKDELIGSDLEVIESSNASNRGIKGKIVFETKSIFEIKNDEGCKKLIKKISKFKITKKGKTFMIDGKTIEKAPEERIKIKCQTQKQRKFLE